MEAERQSEAEAPVVPPAAHDKIQAFVERLLASPDFRIPARRARLLRYLAGRAEAGQANQINEYSIGVDVFDRPESFDPKTDAVVRAEVRRLRQNLKDYNSRRDPADDMILELPARSYALIFRTLAAAPVIATGRKSPAHVQPVRISLAAGTLVLLAAVLVWRWLAPMTPGPPPFSIAVLPAKVTAAATDFANRADAFSQEVSSALCRTRGLSVSDWMKVSDLRGADAVRQARLRLPVALILETEIDRAEGLQVRFRLFGRKGESALWSASAPLGDASHIESRAYALVGTLLSPLLERDFNIVTYRQSTGKTRIQPTLARLAAAVNPCAAKSPAFASLGKAPAQVTIGAQAVGALSPDTRIEIFANGQRAYPSCTVRTKAGLPISVRAPVLVDLSLDTCVLTSSYGPAPVYGDNCIVPPAGDSDVRLMYTCAPKARPIDIARLANDANLWNEETFPSGTRVLAGVPFLIPSGINRFWDAGDDMRGARPTTLTIPVKQPAVSKALFLLNTVWGQPGPATYLALAFTGDRGAYFEKKLIGGTDVRDYNGGVYTNTINGASSRPAFDNESGQRMDLVEVELPQDFQQQTLQTITVTDTGRYQFQRPILWGVTVQ